MDRLKKIVISLCAAISFGGCIENDIPYPYIELSITSVEGEGFATNIDNVNRTVTLNLEEQTDLEAVTISDVECTEGATLSKDVVGTFDMRNPIETTLTLYQSYDWSIVAEQDIEYYFKVQGQIGAERIVSDTTVGTVEVDVDESSYDANNVVVTGMKLGGEGVTTYSPTAENLTYFLPFRWVETTSHGRTKRWKVTVNPIEASVSLSVDAWGKVAWLTGTGVTDDPSVCGFMYKEAVATGWNTVAAETASGGVFTAKIEGLTPLTEYEFMAFVGDAESQSETRTTEDTPQMPNSDFELWQYIGKVLFPYADGGEEYWSSGNTGSAIGGVNITTNDTTEIAPNSSGTTSAKLESKNVIAKFAAGNILTGSFVEVNVTNGTIRFGRPFTQRPLGLRGWVKYNQGTVDYVNSTYLAQGDGDIGIIYVVLGTWTKEEYGYDANGNLKGTDDSPVVIDTRSEATFLNTNSKDVVAYGEATYDYTTDWTEFEIELEYRDSVDGVSAHSRVPTHIIVVAASSRYGDYFTGSTGSTMWVDDFELIY